MTRPPRRDNFPGVIVALLAFSYLIGGIPFGLMVGRWRGVDIRRSGSGNIGSTNVLRVLGPGPAAVVMAADTLKGMLPVLAAQWLRLDPWWVLAAGVLALLGHLFSPFLRLRGGRGVATGLGVLLGISWWAGLVALGIWLVVLGLTRYVSLSSCVAAVSVPFLLWRQAAAGRMDWRYLIFGVLVAVTVLWRHLPNFRRLLAGTESKIGQRTSDG